MFGDILFEIIRREKIIINVSRSYSISGLKYFKCLVRFYKVFSWLIAWFFTLLEPGS